MRVKNKEIPGIVLALGELAQLRLKVPTALKVRKLTRKIEQQQADIETVRMDLIDAYARRDEAGDKVIKEDKTFDVEPVFFEKITELMNLEFEVEPILLADLEGVEAITPATLIGLGELLVEEEAQP